MTSAKDRRDRVMRTPVRPPTLDERVIRWIYLTVASAPLLIVMFQPVPAELRNAGVLWTAAGALLSAQMLLWDFASRRMLRLTRLGHHHTAIHLLLVAAVVVFTPVGDGLAELWRGTPFLTGSIGGLVLAGVATVSWYFAESDIGLKLTHGSTGIRGAISRLKASLGFLTFLRGSLLFLLATQVSPDPGLLTATVYLLVAKLATLAVDTLVTGNVRGRIYDSALFLGQVKQMRNYGDYVVGSWVYDAIVARPGRPDYLLIGGLVGQATMAALGNVSLHRLVSGSAVKGLERPEDITLVWLDVADFALDVAEFRVIEATPGPPPKLRTQHFRWRANVALSRANVYSGQNRYDEALAQRFAAAAASDKAGLPSCAAMCRCLAADLLLLVFDRSEEAAAIVREIATDKNVSPLIARDAFMLYGLCLESWGLREEAKEVLGMARQIPMSPADVRRLNHELDGSLPGKLKRMLRKITPDVSRVHEALLAEAVGEESVPLRITDFSVRWPTLRLLENGRRLQREGDSVGAREEAIRLVELAERLGDMTNLANAHNLLAELAEEEGDWAMCYQHSAKCLDAAEVRRSRVREPSSRVDIGTVRHGTLVWLLTDPRRNRSPGMPERPLAKAFDIAEQYRSRVLLEVLGSSFKAELPSDLRVFVALEQEVEAGYVFEQAVTRRARGEGASGGAAFDDERRAWEKLVSVQNTLEETGPFGAAYVAARRGRPMNYDEVRALLEELRQAGHPALLAEYFVTDSDTVLFLARADYDEPVVVTIENPPHEQWLAATRPFQGERSVLEADSETWDACFRPLVEPLLEHSREGELIWLVPDGVLHSLPLHAVTLEGGPLSLRNPVCVSPNATIMRYCLSGEGGSRLRSGLMLADSRADRSLPHTRIEARTSAEALPAGGEVYVGTEANKAVLTHRLDSGRFDVLHMACHGRFDHGQPMRAGVLLAPSPGDDDREAVLTAEDLLTMRLPVRLVTLSACESGLAEQSSGHELMGLVHAVLRAGVPSVLVTLWSVDEISSSILMRAFYEAIGQGMGPAEALRVARRSVREITVAEAITYCDSAMSLLVGDDANLLRTLGRDIADLHYRAHDFARALDMYQGLLQDAEPGGDEHRSLLSACARCRRAAAVGVSADHGLRPFDHPYYWAAYQLVGDWR